MFLRVAAALLVAAFGFAQAKPDFSDTWVLDAKRSGRQPEIWLQQRAQRFVIRQTETEIAIDTGDGSLFGVRDPVVDGALLYRLDGFANTVIDHSQGDIPGFARKIRTELEWDGPRLVTRTTHYSENVNGASSGNTRLVTFSLPGDGSLKVERTGYRAKPPSELHGRPYRKEDDLVYAKDTAFYIRGSVEADLRVIKSR